MEFEFDARKSASNLAKHGIDFEHAEVLWDDPDMVEIRSNIEVEPRQLLIGKIYGKHWTAVVTYRRDVIRIISVRRSRTEEVALYERQGI